MATNGGSPYGRYLDQRKQDNRADFWKKTILPIAAFATGGAALGAVGAGATAAGLPAGMAPGGAMFGGSVAAPITATAAGLPWLRLAEIGAGAGLNLIGQRQANKAGDRAAQIEEAAARRQEALLREQMAEDRRRWEADQEQQRLDRLAADDERAYARSQSDYKWAQDQAYQARRAPFRAVGRGALMSLANIAGIQVDPSAYAMPMASDGPVEPRMVGSNRQPVSRGYASRRVVAPPGEQRSPSRLIPLSQVGW